MIGEEDKSCVYLPASCWPSQRSIWLQRWRRTGVYRYSSDPPAAAEAGLSQESPPVVKWTNDTYCPINAVSSSQTVLKIFIVVFSQCTITVLSASLSFYGNQNLTNLYTDCCFKRFPHFFHPSLKVWKRKKFTQQ